MSDITRSKKIAKRIKSLKGKIPSGGDLRDFARLVSKVTKKTSRPGKLFANCCECGRIVDTREHYEGGDDHGCELDNGKWVCSFDCWDIAVERDLPDEMRLKLERERKIDEVARLLEGEDMSFIQEVFDKLSLVDSKGNECKYFTSPVPHDEVFADDDDVYEFEIEINNETFPGLADVDVPDIVVTVQCAIRGEGEKASWIAVSQIALIAEDDEEDSSEAMQAGDHCDSPAAEISDTSEPSHSIPISAEKWSVYWPNDCGRTAVSALRYLAQHERPTGGESLYNAAHLEMIAFEVEAVQKCLETLKTADTWQVATFSQVTQALRQLSQDDHLFTPDYLINLADQLERLGATCISLESPCTEN